MIRLSRILKDMAAECRMPPELFTSVWQRILAGLSRKNLPPQRSEEL